MEQRTGLEMSNRVIVSIWKCFTCTLFLLWSGCKSLSIQEENWKIREGHCSYESSLRSRTCSSFRQYQIHLSNYKTQCEEEHGVWNAGICPDHPKISSKCTMTRGETEIVEFYDENSSEDLLSLCQERNGVWSAHIHIEKNQEESK